MVVAAAGLLLPRGVEPLGRVERLLRHLRRRRRQQEEVTHLQAGGGGPAGPAHRAL